MKTQDSYLLMADVFKALAHPTRLALVDALRDGERCVCELAEGQDMSTISKHLSQLKAAGIVEDRRQANKVFYRLRCPCVLDFFSCVTGVLNENLNRMQSACAACNPNPGD